VLDGARLVAAVEVPREESGAGPDLDDPEDFAGTVGSLVAVDPETLALDGVALDAVVETLGLVGEHLFATHGHRLGDVTFLARSSLKREGARRISGFLAGRLFDRGEEE
jgi:hypothetical protein